MPYDSLHRNHCSSDANHCILSIIIRQSRSGRCCNRHFMSPFFPPSGPKKVKPWFFLCFVQKSSCNFLNTPICFTQCCCVLSTLRWPDIATHSYAVNRCGIGSILGTSLQTVQVSSCCMRRVVHLLHVTLGTTPLPQQLGNRTPPYVRTRAASALVFHFQPFFALLSK